MSGTLLNWKDYLQVASLSDVGMRRKSNQDNFSVSLANSLDHFQRKGHLFIVADGMGAHAAGELASKLAIDHIPHLYNKYENSSTATELERAVSDANAEIFRRGQANEEFHNMGTTCSVLTLLPQGAVVAHVGDSRVYRLTQNNRLEQLTFDHSLVWELRAAGQLSGDEEKLGRIPRNVITRSLGPYPEVKVDVEGPFPVQVGDTFLLCSDGLTGVIEDTEIAAVLSNMAPDEAVQVLVDLANLRGGPDNITVVIVKVNHAQLATTGAQPTPGLTARNRDKMISLKLLWGIFIAALFFTFLLFSFSDLRTALLPAAVALIAGIYISYRYIHQSTPNQTALSDGKLRGKGPYSRIACPTGNQFASQLANILDQLKEGAEEQQWRVDWDQWNKMIGEAETAFKEGDYSKSIKDYSRAISFLMDQLRNQNDENASSSSVEL